MKVILRFISHIYWLLTDGGERILISHAPCQNDHHTSYELLRSPRSRFFVAFPEFNFSLTTPEWQEKTKRKMAEQGFSLHQ
jgi:hypothetical protein